MSDPRFHSRQALVAQFGRFDQDNPTPGVTVLRRPRTPSGPVQLGAVRPPTSEPAPPQVTQAAVAATRAEFSQVVREERSKLADKTPPAPAPKKKGSFAERVRFARSGTNVFKRLAAERAKASR